MPFIQVKQYQMQSYNPLRYNEIKPTFATHAYSTWDTSTPPSAPISAPNSDRRAEWHTYIHIYIIHIYVTSEYLCIAYQIGWAGWQVYITEQLERECFRMLLISSRHIVTWASVAWAMPAEVCVSFLFEFSCSCGLDRDGWQMYALLDSK